MKSEWLAGRLCVAVNHFEVVQRNNANLVFYGYVPGRTLVDAIVSYETGRFKYQLNIDYVLNRNFIYASRSNQVIVPGSPTNLRAAVTCKF